MIIAKYGIEFHRLDIDTIELLRQWRNSDSIARYMVYRKYITVEMQREWFNTINNIYNHYFIVKKKGVNIGMFNLRDINWSDKLAEPGGFIAYEKFRASRISAEALLLLFETAFYFLKLETLSGTVLKSNDSVVQTNISLGGEIVGENENSYRISISKERFLEKGDKFLSVANRFHNAKGFSLYFSQKEEDSGFRNELLEKVNYSPELYTNTLIIEG